MSITVKVEGLKQIADAINQLPKATGKTVIRKVLMSRAKLIADDASILAPVKTGGLKRSIVASTRLAKSQRREAKENASYVEVYAGVGAPASAYAHLVEFGSIHNPLPRPFMRVAWDAYKELIIKDLAVDLWAEIEAAVEKLARKTAKG